MNVLLIGSGAREHALAWKLSQSPNIERLVIAPGNGGTEPLGENIPVNIKDLKALTDIARERKIGLVVVGPEEPLADGVVDELAKEGIPCFGPSRAAAQIEASKTFAKEMMARAGIPTARWRVFDSAAELKRYVETVEPPMVLKCDGLAAGKGVVIASTKSEALAAASLIMERKAFGRAGDRVVVEECLVGPEVSVLAFTDGKTVLPMPPACDYKRALDGDTGLNTGGMGAYSPPEFLDQPTLDFIQREVLQKAVDSMAQQGTPYRGVLYAGMMLTRNGPKVLEFNCRFGDPETQVILPRLKCDLLELMLACVHGTLRLGQLEASPHPCVGVVAASSGYPKEYGTGFPISGLDQANSEALVFHAGTKREGMHVVTSGGRVLTVAASAPTIAQARATAYEHLRRIHFQGMQYRTDIAARAVR